MSRKSRKNEHRADYPVLWSRPYALTVLGTLFIFIPYALFLPVLPVYVVEKLHGSLAAAGSVNAVFLIASVLFRAQTSRLETVFGKRRTLLVSCALFLLSNCLYLLVTQTSTLLVIRFFSGACFAIVNTSIMSFGCRIAPQQRIGEGLSYLTTVVTAGTAIGPFAGLSLARLYGFESVFIFSALMTFIGLIISAAIKGPETVANESRTVERVSFGQNYESSAIPVATILLLIAFVYSGVISFATIYANERQLYVAGPYFFVVLATFSILSRLATGKFYDRFGANSVVYPSIMTMAAGLLLLGSANSGLLLLVAAACIGFSYGIAVPSIQTIAIQISPQNRVSAVTATVFTFLDVGLGAGAYLLGVAMNSLGYANVYLLLSPVVLCITVFYYFVNGRNGRLARQV